MSSPIDSAKVAIVPDFSGFSAAADRGIESALRDMISEVRQALAQVERAVNESGANLGQEFQQGGERAEAALRELSRTATTSMNNVSRQTNEAAAGIGSKLGGALGVLKTGLIGAGIGAAAGLGAVTKFGLESAASLEQVQIAFNSLLGGVDAGQKAFTELQQFAACVDTETQALTVNGWRSYSDLQVGDMVLTLNPATGLSEWQPVEAMHVYDGDHEVLHLAGQHHESVSTLNHRWPIHARGQHRHRVLFATSETLDEDDQLIGAAPPADQPLEAVYSDEFVELVAWFWTEGCIHPKSKDLDDPKACVTLRQSRRANPDKCERIQKALEKEFGPAAKGNWGVTGPDADGGLQWRLSRDRGRLLVAAAPEKVPTLQFLRSLTSEQLDLFIAVSMLGDGHIRPQTGQMILTQKRYEQAERFADAVSMSGRRCRVYHADDRRWVVSVYRSSPDIGLSHARRSDVQWTRETVHGVVWCPQVRNGTWFAQRNGHRFFTGNSTPFEFPEVAGAAQRFFAFSGSVGLSKDRVSEFLTTLGNVASVTGGGAQALNSVTLAMGQIASSGKLTLDNLNQISEALPGFSGVAAIASATGKTTAQVMTEISAGSIDAKTGIAALLKGMQTFPGAAGAMEAQAHTLLGVFSTFKDTLSQALVAGFQPVLPAIKDSLTAATPLLGEAIGQLAPALGSLVSAIIPLITQLVQLLAPILKPIVDGIGALVRQAGETGGLAALGKAIGAVAKALFPLFQVVGDVAGVLALALVPVAEALAPIIAELAPTIAALAQAFLPLIPPLGQLIAALLLVITPLIQASAAFLTWFSIEALIPIVSLLAKVLGFCAEAIAEFGKFLTQIDWDAVGSAISGGFSDAWNAVVGFFEGIGEWFGKLPDLIGAGLAAFPGVLRAAAVSAFDTFFQAIGFGIATIIRVFIELPGRVGALISLLWTTVLDLSIAGITSLLTWFSELPGRIGTFISDLWARVKTLFAAGVDTTVSSAKSLPGRILDALKALPGQLFDTGKNMILGLIDGVKATVGRAIDAVKRAMGDIVAGAEHALGIHSPSQVFADAVGVQIPAGIAQGIEAGVPGLQAAMNAATISISPGAGGASAAGSLAGVIINVGGVHFNGAVPTEAEASRTGQAVGAGIAGELQRRNIATAVRTA
jgi:tape measure domain-containing protein